MTISAIKPENQTFRPNQTTDLRLKDIIKSLPRECFQKNRGKAWTQLIQNVLMVVIGYGTIVYFPVYLLPIAWIFTGTALTGFFVIGHDCGHRSFAKRRWVNDLIGHIFMLPLIYPFHGWRIHHNHHHKHTNNIEEDNAWAPWTQESYGNLDKPMQIFYQGLRGRLWWIGSIAHWAVLHFNWNRVEDQKQREEIRFSALLVIITAAIAFPIIIGTLGVWGFVKFWLLPWLVYHFWMSTFTIVHHTLPEIPFRVRANWNEAQAQLFGTVHCDYPKWVEFLCHDINVHIPHHISTAIPSYNLRLAHEILKQKWGNALHQTRFSWDLMKRISDECHLYDEQTNYKSFADYYGN